jgi:hypothetical protein
MKRAVQLLGLVLLSLGIFFMFFEMFSSITGAYLEFSSLIPGFYFFIGVALIIIGIVLTTLDSLSHPTKIEFTRGFEKSLKGRNRKPVENALSKLRSGLANEKYLWFEKKYSIRVDKGTRILYERRPDGSIIVTDYIPSSEHS